MDVILLERVAKLGQIGDVVRVRNGFARNYLLPQGKALRATKENREKFEKMKAQLEARNLERKSEADAVAKRLDGQSFVLLRQAGEAGQLYGSVSTRDIAVALTDGGYTVERHQIVLNSPIKSIGIFKVPVALHPEVEVHIQVNVARSEDEAARQARGEDLTVARTAEEEQQAEARAAAERFFETPPAETAAEAPAKPEAKARGKGREAAAEGHAEPAAAGEARGRKKSRASAESTGGEPKSRS